MESSTLPPELLRILASNLKRLINEARLAWLPPKKYSTVEWLEEHLFIPAEESDSPGRYDADNVPYFWGIMAALDDDDVDMVVLQKAAQIGWTLLLCGWLFKRISTQPSRVLALFSKSETATNFFKEKFEPLGRVCKALLGLIDFSSSRRFGNKLTEKLFPGGFVRGVGSNSPGNVKSTPAPLVVIEEPDDTNKDVGDQGDAIRLAKERVKRFKKDKKIVLGGTPSVKDVSIVEHHVKLGTQRVLPIKCHECDQFHELDWDNVSWQESENGPVHEIYGKHLPETAVYVCPNCGVPWDDWQRQRNVYETCLEAREAGDKWCGWKATAEATGKVESFKELSELYVCMQGTSLADVVADFLEAEKLADSGDESARIVFQNSKLARTYEFTSEDALTADQIESLADQRDELTCPSGGLLVTAGVDVQHDRLAIVIRAFGRNEESWLMYWGESAGDVADKNDPVWTELDKILFSGFAHEKFGKIFTSAVTLDSSDGTTNHAVYHYVRTRESKYPKALIMAGKGDSHDDGRKEIFRLPQKVDHHNVKKSIKADRFGVQVYIVGTYKAKDLIAKRLRGSTAFMHSYKSARPDYWEQVTAEVKAPSKKHRGSLMWQCRSGRRNEALDCEVYALHAAFAKRMHTFTNNTWNAIEEKLSQDDLFNSEDVDQEEQQSDVEPKQKKQKSRRKSSGGFISRYR